jgi:hypothetical protein
MVGWNLWPPAGTCRPPCLVVLHGCEGPGDGPFRLPTRSRDVTIDGQQQTLCQLRRRRIVDGGGRDRAGQGGPGRHPGVGPDQTFQQLRHQARSSSRKLADLAQVVVQAAQHERIAAKAVDDARVRAAEARAREAEQALQAAQTGLARRAAVLDRAQDDADARERAADQRNHLADARERAADERDRTARDSE